MRKFIVLTLVFLLLLSSNIAHAAKIFRLGHTIPSTHISHSYLEKLSDLILERTNGSIKIEVYPGEQLGGARELIESTMRGRQEMAYDGPGVISQFFPKISVLQMPLLYNNLDEVMKVFESEVGQELKQELIKKRNLRILDMWLYGTRHITSNKPIRSMKDFNGLKIRVPEVEEPLATFKALGANPTPISFGEVYFSLQTGVVDAQENPLPTIDAYKFYEVQDYLILTGHEMTSIFVIINEEKWQSLSSEEQKIIEGTVKEVGKVHNEKIMEEEKRLVKIMDEEYDIEVIKVDQSFKNEMRKKLEPVFDKFEKEKWGEGIIKRINTILGR